MIWISVEAVQGLRWNILLVEIIIEALERHHNYSQVVERPLTCCVLHKCIDYFATDLVNSEAALRGLQAILGLAFFNSFPGEFLHIKV